MPLTSISDELDRLRLATPDCRMTAFGDLRARLVLTWSAEGPCPRETLDAIAAEAARAFALSGLIDDSSETLAITSSRDILEAIGLGNGPEQYLITLGYAGWDAGQLEDELLHNAWLNTPPDQQILFSTAPPERWEASLGLLGLDPMILSADAGHA